MYKLVFCKSSELTQFSTWVWIQHLPQFSKVPDVWMIFTRGHAEQDQTKIVSIICTEAI